mgnify:CR=1 FL=1
MKKSGYIFQQDAIAPILADADHIDVKTVDGTVSMRQFVAGLMSYQPKWVTFLYGVRMVFVRLLGMKQKGVPRQRTMQPHEVPMAVGKRASFFKVKAAEEDHYWFAGITESHLTAHLGVVVEPLDGVRKRFHVVTVVHYHQWTGPVYFNMIRPFHHLVVRGMTKQGVKAAV